MRIVCAWCGKDMGEKPPYEDKSITHGICPECYKKVMGEKTGKEDNPMTKEEMTQIVDTIVNKVREEMSTAILILHSTPHAYGSPGIMVDSDVAARTPCKCYDSICFSRGIIGALDKAQREAYCPTTEHVTSPGMTRRMENWEETVDVCKREIEKYEKGERLTPWLECMGRELPKRGIEI